MYGVSQTVDVIRELCSGLTCDGQHVTRHVETTPIATTCREFGSNERYSVNPELGNSDGLKPSEAQSQPEGRLCAVMSAAVWNEEHLSTLTMAAPADGPSDMARSKYNPTPGTGRTGFMAVAPNDYPFYGDDEKYVPIIQADGGQLSEWMPMYNPTPEQAEIDRKKAYESGIPHGYVAPGNKYKDLPTISMLVVSELHDDDEYGEHIDDNGRHSGGPFRIDVCPQMRVEDVRIIIRDRGGILPGLQKLSYAGKNFEDSQRKLEHYGVGYWSQKFDWPIKVRRF